MAVYLVVDQDDAVINRIEWDGTTPYDPGDGLRLIPEPTAATEDAGDDQA